MSVRKLELDLPPFPGKKTIERRVEALTRLLWGQLHGVPIPMTPQAFNDQHRIAYVCTDHPLCVLMQSGEYFDHLDRLHLPDTADDDCPHCGAPPKTRYLGSMARDHIGQPINVVVVNGVDTHQAIWSGRIVYPFAPAICLVCSEEIRNVDTR